MSYWKMHNSNFSAVVLAFTDHQSPTLHLFPQLLWKGRNVEDVDSAGLLFHFNEWVRGIVYFGLCLNSSPCSADLQLTFFYLTDVTWSESALQTFCRPHSFDFPQANGSDNTN